MPGGSGIAGAACRPRPHPLISSGAMTRAPAGPARSTRSAAVSTEQTANTGHLSPRSSPDGYGPNRTTRRQDGKRTRFREPFEAFPAYSGSHLLLGDELDSPAGAST